MIRAIAAIDEVRGIARGGGIPWNIPDDIEYFRQQTIGAAVLMGRTTYTEFASALPARRNVVVSETLKTVRDGFELIDNATQFLEGISEDVWIIGGAALYASTLSICEELYLTHVRGNFGCDRHFPAYDDQFQLVRESPEHEQNGIRFSFAVYRRV